MPETLISNKKKNFLVKFSFLCYGKRVNVSNYKNLIKVTFEGLNVLTNLYTIWHMCILWLCKYTNAKCLAKKDWQQSCWKFGDCKHVKHELPSCYGTVHIWHSLKDLKHWMCRNIDVTEISTALESDIPWGTLNIGGHKTSTVSKY